MNPYSLFVSQRSPFSRRIRLACKRLNLPVEERFMDAFAEPKELMAANPIGQIPVLITPRFGPLCDSTNILEYLQEKSGAIWPLDSANRIRVRQASTLAMGIMNASVLCYQEIGMHEVPSMKWAHDHLSIITGTLDRICESSKSLWIENGNLTQAGWDLCVALEYLSLRVPQIDWKTKNASLAEMLQLARVNSFFSETTPTL